MQEFFSNLNFSSIIWQIVTPLVFMVFDILTGYIQAVINKNVDSSIMRKGLLHKVLLIIIIAVGFLLDFTFNLKTISIAICVYIIVMELTSILENLKKAGIDIKFLDFIKEKGSEEKNGKDE